MNRGTTIYKGDREISLAICVVGGLNHLQQAHYEDRIVSVSTTGTSSLPLITFTFTNGTTECYMGPAFKSYELMTKRDKDGHIIDLTEEVQP